MVSQERLKEVILNIVEENHLELVELQQKRLPYQWLIRVYIGSDQGIKIDDCQKISRGIKDKLNTETDLISGSYILEVSSPGLDRPLRAERDFLRQKGRKVKISFIDSNNETKYIEGTVLDCSDGTVYIEQAGDKVEVPLEKVVKANVKVEI